MSAVTFEGVTFTYPGHDRPALDAVDLQLDPGTFALVAGDTGCGKSTLLRACNGLVPHFTGGRWTGRVLLGGNDTTSLPPRRLAHLAAYVPQDPDASFVVERVEDEIAYALENLGSPASAMRTRVEEMLDLLDIAHLRDRDVRSLSGGERQRVAIAAALAPGAKLLLLDEPTSQLDPQGAEDVLAALQRLVHDLGYTVMIAEHRLERVAGHADVVAAFTRPGRVEIGDPVTLLDSLGAGPPVAHLGRALGWRPTPLTVRDARRFARGAAGATKPESHVAPPATGSTDVRLSGVVASYAGVRALGPIDTTIGSGVTAIVGRNGAGKTTLLRVIAGVHRLDGGAVSVDGAPPDPGRSVALCPQSPDLLLFRETVEDELAAAPGSGRHAYGDEVGILDLAPRFADHPRDLSAGERMLVAVAAVSRTRAPVLCLDEPTRGLDAAAKDRLVALIAGQARAGRAVIVASHDVELVARCAERVLLLAGGEVIADGSAAELMGSSSVFSPQVARVFDGRWLTVDDAVTALTAP